MATQEKKARPLFMQGEGWKQEKGETLWNKDGMQFFCKAEKTWKEIYNSKEKMKVIYNKWERWITTKGKEIKIGEGNKTFHLVMGTWYDTSAASLKTSNDTNDEEGGGVGGGLSLQYGSLMRKYGLENGIVEG
jgi:hypothetical protein